MAPALTANSLLEADEAGKKRGSEHQQLRDRDHRGSDRIENRPIRQGSLNCSSGSHLWAIIEPNLSDKLRALAP